MMQASRFPSRGRMTQSGALGPSFGPGCEVRTAGRTFGCQRRVAPVSRSHLRSRFGLFVWRSSWEWVVWMCRWKKLFHGCKTLLLQESWSKWRSYSDTGLRKLWVPSRLEHGNCNDGKGIHLRLQSPHFALGYFHQPVVDGLNGTVLKLNYRQFHYQVAVLQPVGICVQRLVDKHGFLTATSRVFPL